MLTNWFRYNSIEIYKTIKPVHRAKEMYDTLEIGKKCWCGNDSKYG